MTWIARISACALLALPTAALAAAPPADPAAAERGRLLFTTKPADWSCSTCHTQDPRQPGRHAVTGKAIGPMAPAANPQRLTDPAKVAKWFRRNCKDVFGRECTAAEQDDVLAYLRSLR